MSFQWAYGPRAMVQARLSLNHCMMRMPAKSAIAHSPVTCNGVRTVSGSTIPNITQSNMSMEAIMATAAAKNRRNSAVVSMLVVPSGVMSSLYMILTFCQYL